MTVTVKIQVARTATGKITIEEAATLKRTEIGDLFCVRRACNARLNFTSASHRASAYFRLWPGAEHAPDCPLADVAREVKIIAREAPKGLVQVRGVPFPEFRLCVAQEAFDDYWNRREPGQSGTSGGRAKLSYEKAKGNLEPYVNSAARVVKLRTLIADSDMERFVKLKYRDQDIGWEYFYFPRTNYVGMHHDLTAYQQIPMAVEGRVKYAGPHTRKKDSQVVGLMSLKPQYVRDADDPDVSYVYEPTIWARNPDAFQQYSKDDIVVAFGLWRTSANWREAPRSTSDVTYRNYSIEMSMVIAPQVCVAAED